MNKKQKKQTNEFVDEKIEVKKDSENWKQIYST